MTSSCVEIVIACILFWGNYFLINRKKRPSYSRGEFLLFYIFARVLPFYMMEIRTPAMLTSLASEWVVMGCLYYYLSRRKSDPMAVVGMCFYLFQPVTPYYIITGNTKAIYVVMGILALLAVLDMLVTLRGRSLLIFLPEYLLAMVSVFVYIAVPRLSVQAMMAMGIVFLVIVKKGIGILGVSTNQEETARTGSLDVPEKTGNGEEAFGRKGFTWKDFCWMAGLTVIFGTAILWKLGTTHAPLSEQSLRAEEGQKICLEFEAPRQPVKIYYFLGYSRKNDLRIQGEDSEAGGVYTWNEYTSSAPMECFTLEPVYGEMRINEVICMDEEGKIVYPVNRQEYDALFDEQDTFVENPTYFHETMFDEVYHARTAFEYLHKLPIYENTHPPLGKSIISIGIRLFGMTPFGWRSMSALFGILMVPLFYLFAFDMFHRTDAAVGVTILMGTSFMSTTLSRIATIDIFVAFFVLAMFACMYGFVHALEHGQRFLRQMLWLFGGGLFMGCAIATKWTGFYAAAGAAILFFVFLLQKLGGIRQWKEHRRYLFKTFLCCVIFFILIPLCIYTLSYLPFLPVYTDRTLWGQVIGNGRLMLDYHKTCVFYHPYSSEWYQWLVGIKPLADSRVSVGTDEVSVVMTFLNPLLCISGLAAFFFQFYLWKNKKDKNALFLIIAYLSMLLPWLLIHRTVFIYQYFISAMLLPFMLINSIRYSRHPRRNGVALVVMSVLLYGLYYRVLTGRVESIDWINQALELFREWNIA